MVDWFFATLKQYPEIAIFLTLGIGYYFCKGNLRSVDGMAPIEQVAKEIDKVMSGIK